MTAIYYYQNNPCKIIRDISEDFAEVEIAHKFCTDMDGYGHCMGCNVGDSDNKLSCTCDDYAWIIEEFQSEENKILVIVEKRLLLKQPVEHNDIVRLKNCIKKQEDDLKRIKDIHQEWHESLKLKQASVEALDKKADALKAQIESLESEYKAAQSKTHSLKSELDETLVEITNCFSKPKKISRKEYDYLVKRNEKLEKLEAGGVDNWEWYDESLKESE